MSRWRAPRRCNCGAPEPRCRRSWSTAFVPPGPRECRPGGRRLDYNSFVGPDSSFVNLPHALTIVGRLTHYLYNRSEPTPVEQTGVRQLLAELDEMLRPYPTDPPPETAVRVAGLTAEPARRLVRECIRAGYRGDRLGQCIRNLFECLGLAAEGAALSLECGERPDSPLRP